MSVTVTTQAELDAALAAKEPTVYISSPEGVWLWVSDSDSSHVEARGSSHVVARGSSHVVARGSSHVEAWDSSHVEAWGSSHVEAWGSSHVVARDSSHVEARPYVAVHLHSGRASVEGGVLIDLTALDLADAATWADFHGATTEDGATVVYKAVNGSLRSGRGCEYPIGETVEAPDWRADSSCGGGLHFGPTPRHAKVYHEDATRFLACRVPLADARGITDGGTAKIKARSCVVLYEVDIDGKPVAAEQVSA